MEHFSEVKEILKKRGVNKKIDLNTRLDSLGLDSLDLMDCVVEAEERLDIHIDDNKISDMETIQDFIDVIKSSEA